MYVKWTVAGLASSYVTVNSIFLASSTLDLDQSAVVFFLDNGKKFPASAIAGIQFFTKFSANCCKKKGTRTQVDQGDYKQNLLLLLHPLLVKKSNATTSSARSNGLLFILTLHQCPKPHLPIHSPEGSLHRRNKLFLFENNIIPMYTR